MATLIYSRLHRQEEKGHESVEEALRTAYWGEETGNIFAERVLDDEGERVYDYVRDGNIFEFCEDRDYDWIADY